MESNYNHILIEPSVSVGS